MARVGIAAAHEPCSHVEAFADDNHALLTMIYAGTHNSVIADMAAALRRRLAPYRRAQLHLDGRPSRSFEEHDAAISAIVRGDAPGAHAAMLHHVTLMEQSYEELCASRQQTKA